MTVSLSWLSRPAAVAAVGFCVAVGCNSRAPVAPGSQQTAAPTATSASGTSAEVDSSETDGTAAPAKKRRSYAPVQLGSGGPGAMSGVIEADKQAESVLEQLQPLQVLLGKWSGNARKAAALHSQQWVWDFQSVPEQPALVLKAEKSPYIEDARLTYLPKDQQFEMKLTTAEGAHRDLRGTFLEPVTDVAGDDEKLQRTFKLELKEAQPATDGEEWQVVLHQLENNRYLIELDRRRGTGPFQRVDTIHSQREGTSFALSDSDYGDKTCIISQGLGTISVSHKGRSYWVCCTGCQAAFQDDPEKWIAKWEARQKEMGKE